MTPARGQPGRWLVIEIGCLECGHPSDVLGVYATLQEAREKHPHATQRTLMDDQAYGDWHGESVDVIYDLQGTPGEAQP